MVTIGITPDGNAAVPEGPPYSRLTVTSLNLPRAPPGDLQLDLLRLAITFGQALKLSSSWNGTPRTSFQKL
jgi:hypothetical protein